MTPVMTNPPTPTRGDQRRGSLPPRLVATAEPLHDTLDGGLDPPVPAWSRGRPRTQELPGVERAPAVALFRELVPEDMVRHSSSASITEQLAGTRVSVNVLGSSCSCRSIEAGGSTPSRRCCGRCTRWRRIRRSCRGSGEAGWVGTPYLAAGRTRGLATRSLVVRPLAIDGRPTGAPGHCRYRRGRASCYEPSAFSSSTFASRHASPRPRSGTTRQGSDDPGVVWVLTLLAVADAPAELVGRDVVTGEFGHHHVLRSSRTAWIVKIDECSCLAGAGPRVSEGSPPSVRTLDMQRRRAAPSTHSPRHAYQGSGHRGGDGPARVDRRDPWRDDGAATASPSARVSSWSRRGHGIIENGR